MADPFVDWNGPYDDAPDDELQPLAAALWWHNPPTPYGPDDDYEPECPT